MQRVLRELEWRRIDLGDLRAIELFGGSGAFHTLDYAPRVKSLEVWEINPELEARLAGNLPEAKIRITDTYSEIKDASKRYDLIICDNPMSLHGSGDGHCEHFDLFPHIFRIAADSAVLILNIIPRLDNRARKRFPYLFNETQLAARREFYCVEHPENISPDIMISIYTKLASESGFTVEWTFLQRRHFVYYLVMRIRKLEGITKSQPSAASESAH